MELKAYAALLVFIRTKLEKGDKKERKDRGQTTLYIIKHAISIADTRLSGTCSPCSQDETDALNRGCGGAESAAN